MEESQHPGQRPVGRRGGAPRAYFLFPSTVSFRLLARRNLHTRLAGILSGSPVCGLRPMRALRLARTSLPKPGSTKPFFASLHARLTVSSKISAICFFDRLAFGRRYPTVADFVIIFATSILLSVRVSLGTWAAFVPQAAGHGYRWVKRNAPDATSRRYDPKRASASSTMSSGAASSSPSP